MILSRKHKYVFISTPKTGSHTFFDLLQKEFDGERIIPEYHRTKLPENVDNYTFFSTVRNPYDRLVALWSAVFSMGSKDRVPPSIYRSKYLEVLGTDNFLNFCKYVAKHKDDIEKQAGLQLPILLIPQHRWYNQRLPKNVIPLHLENIKEEFHKLPFVNIEVKIPHKLKGDHPSWDDLKNDEIIYYANEWAGNDFEKFNYKKEYPSKHT